MKQAIPPQHTGKQSDTSYSITTATDEQAQQLFLKARKNLLSINSWKYLSGTMSASFQLLNAQAQPIYQAPQEGDLFKINIPGPGGKNSQGYDWVKVEVVEENLHPQQHSYIAIRVRPTKSPTGHKDAHHHFFTGEATSTFLVKRDGKIVTAEVLGRNEKPNTESHHLFTKIRNAIVGFMAMVGLNKPQWKALVKGILEKDADAITFQE